MKQKKLMLLGGLRYLIPVIEAAHKEGYYVITCDYLPNNIAHQFSDEYCNVSIIDKDAVLEKAQELEIDGIMSFAVDPGVVTAAYVAEKLNLPFAGSYESIKILQNKDMFRKFLSDHNFNTPKSSSYRHFSDALDNIKLFDFPVIIKPTDSAGSKGVTRVDEVSQLKKAFQHALDNSLSRTVIIEEFIKKLGCSSDSDAFSVNGRLEIVTYSAQRFDDEAANPYTPSAYSWPSTFTNDQVQYLNSEIQRLITLLNLKTSIYNIETRIGLNGKPYIMEVSPRGGGNRLAEMVRFGSGVDMITASVRAAVGDPVGPLTSSPFDGHWAEVILHSDSEGEFESIEIKPEYKDNVYQTDLWVKKGDVVHTFRGANDAIGTLVMQFQTEEELDVAMSNVSNWLNVVVK